MKTVEPPRICGPAWFQDDYYSPEGHWLHCDDPRTHLEPVIVWIGSMPISHGERDSGDGPKGDYDYPCLCGHPEYSTCPHNMAGEGSIISVVIEPATPETEKTP